MSIPGLAVIYTQFGERGVKAEFVQGKGRRPRTG